MAGALSQVPVGILSDRIDRRMVLLGLCLMAIAADAIFIVFTPYGQAANLLVVALFGATSLAIYPVAMAHANDHAAPGEFIQTSAGILMVLGIGSIVGPLLGGMLMNTLGPQALFYTTIGSHSLTAVFVLARIATSFAVPRDQKGAFRLTQPGRIGTPEAAVLIEESNAVFDHVEDAGKDVEQNPSILKAA